MIKKANQGDTQALSRLISGFDAKTGVGSYIRTPEEIAASNKRIWDNLGRDLKNIAGEVLPIYDTIRLITGKDPVTGEKTSRWTAAAWIGAELIPGNDLFKGGKLLEDVGDFTKVSDKIDDAQDSLQVAENLGDAIKGYQAPKGGGGTTTTILKGEVTITFGHGARHFEDIPNLKVLDVEEAIAQHVVKNPPKIGESPRVTISVNGQIVEYRPFNLGDGRINIGTYIPKNK